MEKENKNCLYWHDLFNESVEYMRSCLQKSHILIEVAAQHPLNEDGTPGKEFQARLDYAIEMVEKFSSLGKRVYLYVPGSVHLTNGIQDKISLSDSGKNYLILKGIDKEFIFGEDMNLKYKGEEGVYNSADECFVTASIFKDGDYRCVYCICSSAQAMRKKLHYLAFGIIPFICTVDVVDSFHNFVDEAMYAVPNVLYDDHTGQDDDSVLKELSRRERKPGYKK